MNVIFFFVLRTGITKKNQHFCKLMCLSYRRRQKRRQGVKLYHVTPARDNTDIAMDEEEEDTEDEKHEGEEGEEEELGSDESEVDSDIFDNWSS